MNNFNKKSSISVDHLRSFINRIEKLEEEKKNLNDDIQNVYLELKNNGFDIKAVRSIIRLRKKKEVERQEEEAIIDFYKEILGMI